MNMEKVKRPSLSGTEKLRRASQDNGAPSASITEELIKGETGDYDMDSIYKLSLSNLGIKRIENMHLIPNVTDLSLASNKLTKIEGLDQLAQLRKLNLSHNRITKLENLDSLEMLEQLQITNNLISNVDHVACLQGLEHFKVLYLRKLGTDEANPLCGHPSYRPTVLRLLPNLTNLDGERLNGSISLFNTEDKGAQPASKLPVVKVTPWFEDLITKSPPLEAEVDMSTAEKQFQDEITSCKRLTSQAAAMIQEFQLTPR